MQADNHCEEHISKRHSCLLKSQLLLVNPEFLILSRYTCRHDQCTGTICSEPVPMLDDVVLIFSTVQQVCVVL